MQQNDPIIGEIYRTVLDQTPAPTPEMLTARNLYSHLSSLRISDQGVLYRIFTDHYSSQTYHQIVVPTAREIADDLHRGLNRGHLRHRRAKKLLRKRFFWRGWSLDVLFCSLAFLDLRVGHTMDVLSPFIPILCHSD